jgi:hypothetical protein
MFPFGLSVEVPMRARTIIPNRVLRQSIILLAAAGAGCSSRDSLTQPGTITLDLEPTSVVIPLGASLTLDATLTRGSSLAGSVVLTVSGAPAGVGVVVSEVRTTGLVTTARITISVAASVVPASYSLNVLGSVSGLSVMTPLVLLVPLPTGLLAQWASSATASSQYTTTEWSAGQATGPPNVAGCSDNPLAWASLGPGGVEWLELGFQDGVRPTEVRIYENFGVGSLVKVEVRAQSGAYHTVYTALPGSLACPRVLTIPVSGIEDFVNGVRLSFDQSVLQDWNEIDAVRLTGYLPGDWDYLRPR